MLLAGVQQAPGFLVVDFPRRPALVADLLFYVVPVLLPRLPTRLARHTRRCALAISETWPRAKAFLTCWQQFCVLPALT